MTAEQFAYWMQGFVELNGVEPTAEQWQSIKEHLATVFVKVTPPVFGPLRTLELRPEDMLRTRMNEFNQFWPNGGAPVITC